MYITKIVFPFSNSSYNLYCYKIFQEKYILIGRWTIKTPQDWYKWLNNCPVKIDIAIIPPIHIYHNNMYANYPSSIIIIEKQSLAVLLQRLFFVSHTCYDEIAATKYSSEEKENHQYMLGFLEMFYSKNSKQEALQFYREWQTDRALNNWLENQLVEIIDTYEEEIMNYFIYQEIVMQIERKERRNEAITNLFDGYCTTKYADRKTNGRKNR